MLCREKTKDSKKFENSERRIGKKKKERTEPMAQLDVVDAICVHTNGNKQKQQQQQPKRNTRSASGKSWCDGFNLLAFRRPLRRSVIQTIESEEKSCGYKRKHRTRSSRFAETTCVVPGCRRRSVLMSRSRCCSVMLRSVRKRSHTSSSCLSVSMR